MYVDDKPHGDAERYWPNGQLRYKITYVNGIEHGFTERYWSNGKLIFKRTYMNGKLIYEEDNTIKQFYI